MSAVSLSPVTGLPLIRRGDDVASLIVSGIRDNGIDVQDDSIVVVAQKIVSKAEGRAIRLDSVTPGEEALALAKKSGKDARLVELILSESRTLIRQSGSLIITENNLGIIMANAGIDQSNIDDGFALLLPEDPDGSARRIADVFAAELRVRPGVVIADSTGRPWRKGVVGIAIGVHGIPAVLDVRGCKDLNGRELSTTEVGFADGISAAATLLMGQGDEGVPVVVVNGLDYEDSDSTARDILRAADHDLFR